MAPPIDPRLLRRGRATRNFLVALAVIGIGSAGLMLAQAWLLSRSISTVFATQSTAGVWGWAGLLLAVFTARAILVWLNQWLAHHSSAAVKSGLRRDVMAARLSRPTDSSVSSASMINLITKGLDDLDGYYAKYLPQLVLAVVVPSIIIVAIATQDIASAIIIAVTIPLIPVFMALIGWTTEKQVKRRFAVQNRLANHFADLITGLPTLQVFGRAKAQSTGLEITEASHRDETMKTLRISFLSSFALELLASLSVAVVAVTVGFRVVFSQLDFTTALFVLILAPEAYLPVRQVGVHYHDAADGMAAADEALSIIEAEELPSGTTLPQPGADIEFNGVSFRYPDTDRAALPRLDALLRSGTVSVLRGPSGGGKSTACSLLMGFLTPGEGTISVGGTPQAELDQAAWRARLAYVPQSPGMLPGSIAENVRLGAPDATDEQVRDALDKCGAEQLDPARRVGDDAEGLSAGERRRVALARALLRIDVGGAEWLVLDEPTAGLDAGTEAAVLDAVRQTGAGAVVVSHRATVIERADQMISVGAAAVAGGAK